MKKLIASLLVIIILTSSFAFAEKINIFKFLDSYHRELETYKRTGSDYTIKESEIFVMDYMKFGDSWSLPEGNFTFDDDLNITSAVFDLRDLNNDEKTVRDSVRATFALMIMEKLSIELAADTFSKYIASEVFDTEKMHKMDIGDSKVLYYGNNYIWKIAKTSGQTEDQTYIGLYVFSTDTYQP